MLREDEGSAAELRFDEAGLRKLLTGAPYPSRDPEQNVADVRAQIAANQRGVELLNQLVSRYGYETVQAYMGHIQTAAETKMRQALAKLPAGERRFTDRLDDGAAITVRLTIAGDGAILDFTGTAGVHPGNLNATPAIVGSAALYCFRCLIADDIPLNAGVGKPLRITLPPGLLNPPANADPARCAAVAGGNVETSQRVVDVIFGALGVVAASQGTMNNLTFGDAGFGYYETICGGAGAGPDYDGADAVHTHMTNTRLTDPEVLEDRYPVSLIRFAIRRGTGGAGLQRGGDGVTRELHFLAPLEVALVTQRRRVAPYGVDGGDPAKTGRNTLIRASGQEIDLGPMAQLTVAAGDRLIIETPGGGGFGSLQK